MVKVCLVLELLVVEVWLPQAFRRRAVHGVVQDGRRLVLGSWPGGLVPQLMQHCQRRVVVLVSAVRLPQH